MRQSINSYIKTLGKLAERAGVTDLRTQVNIWPYPQSRQSHISIWRQSWVMDTAKIPSETIYVGLNPGDCSCPGALVHVADDAPTPSELVLIPTLISRT